MKIVETKNWGRKTMVDIDKLIYVEEYNEHDNGNILYCLNFCFVGNVHSVFYYDSKEERDSELKKIIKEGELT